MPNRIKLLVNQSGFDSGIHYLIYRGDFSPVKDDEPLIEVDEQTVQKRVQTQMSQVLTQRYDAPSCFYAPHVFIQSPAPQVYVDGEPVANENVNFYPNEKMIRIHQPFIFPTTSIVTMDYQYLQSVVEDDYTAHQTGVTHKGDYVPTGILPPKSISYESDTIAKTLKIIPVHDDTVESHYYRIRFLDTVKGRVSQPSTDRMMSITPNTFDLKWILEISRDGGETWEELQEQPLQVGEFVLTNVDDITANPHIPLPFTITPTSTGAVEIRIKNPWYMWEENVRKTHLYRIKTVDNEGQESKFKEFEEGGVNYRPTLLKLRRKKNNDTPALFEGTDALTLHEVTEMDVDITASELVFVDDHLKPGSEYSYTFHLEDELGRRTPAFWGIVKMPTA